MISTCSRLFPSSTETIFNLSKMAVVEVEKNEVKGFQCNVNTSAGCSDDGELHICINTTVPVKDYTLETFIDQPFQNPMAEIQSNVSDDQCFKKFVNLKVLTQQDYAALNNASKKDDAFVVLIPNGTVLYCVFGAENLCRNIPVLGDSATKYNITEHSPNTCVCSTPTVSPSAVTSSVNTPTGNPHHYFTFQ
jgi:hypothetical protein